MSLETAMAAEAMHTQEQFQELTTGEVIISVVSEELIEPIATPETRHTPETLRASPESTEFQPLTPLDFAPETAALDLTEQPFTEAATLPEQHVTLIMPNISSQTSTPSPQGHLGSTVQHAFGLEQSTQGHLERAA